MATDTLTARREIAWLDAALGQRDEVADMLGVAAGMAMILAKSSKDDVAAIQRTYDHLVARFNNRPSKLSPDDALIAMSVVFSAIAMPGEAAVLHDDARCDRLEREQMIPRGFPKLYFHKPPLRANRWFPGVLLCKAAE
jgi:hypothetical protein